MIYATDYGNGHPLDRALQQRILLQSQMRTASDCTRRKNLQKVEFCEVLYSWHRIHGTDIGVKQRRRFVPDARAFRPDTGAKGRAGREA